MKIEVSQTNNLINAMLNNSFVKSGIDVVQEINHFHGTHSTAYSCKADNIGLKDGDRLEALERRRRD